MFRRNRRRFGVHAYPVSPPVPAGGREGARVQPVFVRMILSKGTGIERELTTENRRHSYIRILQIPIQWLLQQTKTTLRETRGQGLSWDFDGGSI